MTILAWQQGGAARGPAVVPIHAWASDGTSSWQDTGWVAGCEQAGLTVYVPDLPGHGESADVLLPPDAEPAAWTAAAMVADLAALHVSSFFPVGHVDGCLVAGHLAVRAEAQARAREGGRNPPGLVLVGCDDRPGIPHAAEVVAALRDPTARVWNPAVAEQVARARTGGRHHLPTLAEWADRAAWPAAPRLGALRTPVLLAVGAGDPRRERAPRLAQLFHDARLVTVPGDAQSCLSAPELVATATRFLLAGADQRA